MSRWPYYLLILALVAPIISAIGGTQQSLAIFVSSALGLIPLAALIGRATEDLDHYVGPVVGGLLNATFGNAPEIIIGIFALQQGLIVVVKASITGSIISNALLVLGGSLALGGVRWGRQYFDKRDAAQYSAMLVVALAGLLIPFTAKFAITDAGPMQTISVIISVILMCIYVLYLALHVFRVRATRRNPLQAEVPSEHKEVGRGITGSLGWSLENSKEYQPTVSLQFALLTLLLATIGTAWNSQLLVGTIEPVAAKLGWSDIFIGLVIIPIVGNAVEHSSALLVAYKDRVDLSMAIAAGSSIQVAMFVAPLLVLVSFFFTSRLDLIFQPLELVILGLATILFAFVSLDGESSWLAGLQLIAMYIMACVVFFFAPG